MDDTTARRVERLRRLARLLDGAVRVPVVGYRIGLDPVLGLLPVGGDLLGAAFSLAIVAEAARLGAPKAVLSRMLLNVGIDALGGAVPFLGIVVDAVWKANERNLALLERWVQ